MRDSSPPPPIVSRRRQIESQGQVGNRGPLGSDHDDAAHPAAARSARVREAGVASVLDFDLEAFDPKGNADPARFARFVLDRVRLAYGDAETERGQDRWDLRHFGHSGHLDFSPIRQDWLRAATKAWASAALVRVRFWAEVQHRVQAVAVKDTGRRVAEIAGLHLQCLAVDEHGKPVLVYDNHKAARMGRRLPLADSQLVEAIRAQQRWVAERFPATPRDTLWLLPRPNKNAEGTAHLTGNQISLWIRAWVARIPRSDAGIADQAGEAVPFDRTAIHPHAFRHTYAQTLADEGVPPSVLRDLMDHRSMNTTLGYYRVAETKKRQAMELLARHTVDHRATARPVEGELSRAAELREQLSWVAVPMGKCSEPTNVRAGGQACPIRYQCAGCPHFESDPSYLPELRAYADDLRREREATLAVGAATWVVDNVAHQLKVVVGHIRAHEELLERLPPSSGPMTVATGPVSVLVRRGGPSRQHPDAKADDDGE